MLLLALDFCTTYCRYCTRSRVVGHGEIAPSESRLEQAFEYLRNATEVRDVLISGGDPLTLSNDRLAWILHSLQEISPTSNSSALAPRSRAVAASADHAGSLPDAASLPPAVDERPLPPPRRVHARGRSSLRAGWPTPASRSAQTVLLRGVNDDLDTMRLLMHRLLRMRVRPYYLYQCDPISGSAHFRTPVSRGLEIIEGLRGHTTGYAVPTYVIDAPGGGGKISLQPDAIVGRDGDDLLLRNFEGAVFRYPDTADGAPLPAPIEPEILGQGSCPDVMR